MKEEIIGYILGFLILIFFMFFIAGCETVTIKEKVVSIEKNEEKIRLYKLEHGIKQLSYSEKTAISNGNVFPRFNHRKKPKIKNKRKQRAKTKRANKTKRLKKVCRKNETFYQSKEWREVRYKAFKLHGRKCLCCGESPPNTVLHVDHIKPRSKYPELELDINNLQILCKDCNLGKSNYDCIDYRLNKGEV